MPRRKPEPECIPLTLEKIEDRIHDLHQNLCKARDLIQDSLRGLLDLSMEIVGQRVHDQEKKT